jgi:hypothetical protein
VVLLAEMEVFHNRNYSPTRRLALGRCNLPLDPPPGFGPMLLGGVVAVGAEELDHEDHDAVRRLLGQLEHGQRIVQPRIRHRFQSDHHGLARTTARLVGGDESLEFDFDGNGSPLQMTLASIYAAGQLPMSVRPRVFDVVRKGLAWKGPIGPSLISHLSGKTGAQAWSAAAFADPRHWALELLGFGTATGNGGKGPNRKDVQRRFRELLRSAHPDHGGEIEDAAERIADLTEARRILLGA